MLNINGPNVNYAKIAINLTAYKGCAILSVRGKSSYLRLSTVWYKTSSHNWQTSILTIFNHQVLRSMKKRFVPLSVWHTAITVSS